MIPVSADSPETGSGPRAGGRVALLFLVFVALSALTRALLFVAPPLSDEPVHLLGSWELLRGGRLYVDFVDNKPPLLYTYYAGAQAVFGPGLSAVRLFTLLAWIPLTALAAAAFYRYTRAGIAAGVLYLVAGASFVIDEGLAVNTEVLMLLPSALAFVALARMAEQPEAPSRRALVAGAWLGMAALFKVTAVLWLPAAAVVAWLAARPPARWSAAVRVVTAAAAGFALPWLVEVQVLALRGTLREFVELAIGRNIGYVAATVDWGEALRRAATGAGAWALATLPLWWAAWVSSRRMPAAGHGEASTATPDGTRDGLHSPDSGLRPHPDTLPQQLAIVITLLALPAVVIGARFFAHYYLQVLFPLCLAAAPAVARWTERPIVGRASRISLAWLACALVAFTIRNAWVVLGASGELESRRPVYGDVAAWIRADPCAAGASLFVWGREPMFYVASRLRPASRFVLPQETLSGHVPGRSDTSEARWPASDSGPDWDRLMDDLERTRATYVLDTSTSHALDWGEYKLWRYPRLFLYLRHEYEQAVIIDRVVVHRRKGCGHDPTTR